MANPDLLKKKEKKKTPEPPHKQVGDPSVARTYRRCSCSEISTREMTPFPSCMAYQQLQTSWDLCTDPQLSAP